MHSLARVTEALRLLDTGATPFAVARATGIPRTTIRDWRAGALPSTYRRARDGRPPGSCSRCGGKRHGFAALPPTYAYLLGLYLGDGSIARHRRDVYKLRIVLDARYPRIIDECEAAMRTVMPSSRVNRWARRYGDIEVYAYSKAWPCLFPQHGPGPKHRRPIVLTDWQQALADRYPDLIVRGLIHSDGCRFLNTGRRWSSPRYRFDNLSSDIRRIFRDACERLRLRWTQSGRATYVSRKSDVAALDELVGPKC